MHSRTADIAAVTSKGIERVQDTLVRTALEEAYGSRAALSVMTTAQNVFRRLTASRVPIEVLARFVSGWRSTHGTSLFVSGLIVRLQREAQLADLSARTLLFESAAEVGEIIAEDTGVDDTPHNELFTRFADRVVGDDRWKLSAYSMPACEQFRKYVKQERLAGPIEEAILVTAASESWNSGEYSYCEPVMRQWMRAVLGHSNEALDDAIAYVSHHTGDVELGHFLHALDGWALYCKAKGKTADPGKVRQVFESYFDHLQGPFRELELLLETA